MTRDKFRADLFKPGHDEFMNVLNLADIIVEASV
jgi:hypothetical protein